MRQELLDHTIVELKLALLAIEEICLASEDNFDIQIESVFIQKRNHFVHNGFNRLSSHLRKSFHPFTVALNSRRDNRLIGGRELLVFQG